MKHEKNIETRLEQLARAIGSGDSFVNSVMSRLETSSDTVQKPTPTYVRRLIMKPFTKFAAAAMILIAAFLSLTLFDKTVPVAYAIEQTLQAFKNIQYLHVIRYDDAGEVEDERWIEIKPDGSQGRYRQDTPGDLLVVDDGQIRYIYRRDKNAVLLYDLNGPQYTWIFNLHNLFKDMADDDSAIIEKNVNFNGRTAHLIRWRKLNAECYIDPKTKLPIGLGRYEIYYNLPPEGTFDIPNVPPGVYVYDKRQGALPSQEPDWLKNENQAEETFEKATIALSEKKYQDAIDLFKEVFQLAGTEINWAWFWLGQAYYQTGEYNAAIDSYTKVIEIFEKHDLVPHYAFLARGMCYRKLGLEDAAWNDFKIALPVMVEAICNTKSAEMFDYADDPINKGRELSEDERFSRMLSRLQDVAQEDVAVNLTSNNKITAAWEEWWQKKSSQQLP